MKRCWKCKTEKNKTEFGKDSRQANGLSSCCIECNRILSKEQKANGYSSGYAKTEKGKDSINRASKRAYQNHKHKWLARAKARYAVKTGQLNKPIDCEGCGLEKLLHGHHEDYTKPLEVNWICQQCHTLVHHYPEKMVWI